MTYAISQTVSKDFAQVTIAKTRKKNKNKDIEFTAAS